MDFINYTVKCEIGDVHDQPAKTMCTHLIYRYIPIGSIRNCVGWTCIYMLAMYTQFGI